jgi:geranylgeranyl reductase family protein
VSGGAYDAIVVGAGPGGASAAYWLAAAGRRVVVLDKATFPREKVCGDGLTPRAVRCLLAMGVETAGDGWARADGLRIIGAGTTLELPWPELSEFPGYGLVRTRLDLDGLVLDRARAAGADVWEATSVTGPITDSSGTVVGVNFEQNGTSEQLRAPVVVASDGAASRFGTSLGGARLPDRPMGVAVRTYYESPRSRDRYLESYLELWRGSDLLPGYGWIFPLPGGLVNVGLGLLNTSPHFGHVHYRELLDDWVAALPAEWGLRRDSRIGKVRGGPLPMGFSRKPVARPGMLLVGDAAGVVNPFNGEGIAYAMETGRMAAEAADEALSTGDPRALRGYPDRLRAAYEGYYILGRWFVRAIGHGVVMRTLTRYGLPNERLMRFAFKVLANLTEPAGGSSSDRLINALCRIAPAVASA